MTQLILIDDLARRLHTSPRSLHRYVKDGRLAAVRIGKRLQFVEEDVEKFISSARQEHTNKTRKARSLPAFPPMEEMDTR